MTGTDHDYFELFRKLHLYFHSSKSSTVVIPITCRPAGASV